MPQIPSMLAIAIATGALFTLSSTPVYANSPALHRVKLQDDGGPTAKRVVRYGNWRILQRWSLNSRYGGTVYYTRELQYVYWSDGSVSYNYRTRQFDTSPGAPR